MKRFLMIGVVIALLAGLLYFLLRVVNPTTDTSEVSTVDTQQVVADTNTNVPSGANTPKPEGSSADAGSIPIATNGDNEFEQLVRKSTEAANIPVAFYGMVVDQDSNPLQNVTVDLQVIEERVDSYPQHNQRRTPLQKQTDTEGRFEVIGSGLKGRFVLVFMLTKDGYDREAPGAMYGTQSTSFENPAVLTLWRTNSPREQLITGVVDSAVVPDGRRYGVDLIKKAVNEGAEGDLVVCLKRPDVAGWEKYDWSCELTANGGGLVEETSAQPMIIAPETGYTNLFTYRQEAANNDWTHGLYGKRFYIRLRNGQIYGRITVNVSSSPNRKVPAMLWVEYVINPSGSRILR